MTYAEWHGWTIEVERKMRWESQLEKKRATYMYDLLDNRGQFFAMGESMRVGHERTYGGQWVVTVW
jgi:hypothetical protein